MLRAAALTIIVFAAPLLPVVSAQKAAPTPEAAQREFNAAFKSIHDQMAAGRLAEALPRLKKLVDDHQEDGLAVANRDRIVEDWKLCAFRAEYPAPDPKTLVKGDLISYDASSGRIKIREKALPGDFVQQSGMTLFPAAFVGPHTIEIKGKSWALEPISGALVCVGNKTAWRLTWGFPQPSNKNEAFSWMPASIESFANDAWTIVQKNEKPPCVPQKPYTFKIDVQDRQVSGAYNGTPYLRAPKAADAWGHFGFVGADPAEVTLEGRIEKSWIEGKIDAMSQTSMGLFTKSWNPEKEIPGWLMHPKAKDKGAALDALTDEDTFLRGAPHAVGIDQEENFNFLYKRIERGEVREAEARLRGLTDADLPAVSRTYLSALCDMTLGRLEPAQTKLTAVLAEEPKFAQGWLALANLHLDRGKFDDAVAALEKSIGAAPGFAMPYATLIALHMSRGDHPAAQRTLERARAARPNHPIIEGFGKMLAKSESGPPFTKTFEYKTSHYIVKTDIDAQTASRAGQLLEDALSVYSLRHRRVPAKAGTFRVFLFSGLAGYESYLKGMQLRMPIHTAGLYSSQLKQLLIWNLPQREEMMRTVRHEGLHQYLDAVFPNEAPRWFDEGLAVYYEYAKLAGGAWTTGALDCPELTTAKEKQAIDPVRLATFLYETPEAFYRNAKENYATAWAFITFLRETTPARKKAFDDLFNFLADGGSAADALAKFFPKDGLPAVEDQFHAWLRDAHP